ncbi:class I ribonucleotide reductase maintenance protein YfaE [Photobacterium aquimaris]|uniref:(2Fe-2S)-binding protein n=1 Tax=Photobacterium aquimaris TaxID=512643 RepID=A0A2T3I009_9GAMM|nr:class I ribonucleotide reductase maintenance protein YfaE [Photobacterium aquimaris]MCP4955798.1 2Fe-2S iron-sulfur cluster binding domain-containing protein [Photobacterium aquimaris]OBU26522.1 (2Fe-2S)-binding protein [Photobacterium aquimaris]PQJ40730.1 (2Fe-2S)-binding protein [Photobacterium aquimaris]PSU07933.1 (2Fe-2S)-binding protein [Photobacterium aquimaris]
MSQLTFTVNGIKVYGNRHEPLLTQLEKAGIKPEYQCRNGICGACRCKLISGSVTQQDALAFIAPNEILSCCSIPQQNIKVHFDYQLNTEHQATKTKIAL